MSLFRSSLSLSRSAAGRSSAPLFARFVAEGGRPASEVGAGHPDTSNEINTSKAAKSIRDSTSALDYKLGRHPRPPPLPAFHPVQKSAEDHVLSILYNTPPPSAEPFKRHILNCLVQNEPGVLSRVSGILAARGFNIDSLVVCQTEVRDLSRMCIVLRGQDGVIEQARRQLEDLVPVWAVLDYTKTNVIQRELLMVKISTLGPEYFEDQMSFGPSLHPSTASSSSLPSLPTSEPSPSGSSPTSNLLHSFEHASDPTPSYSDLLTHSEALIRKGQHFAAIQALSAQFGGSMVDVSLGSVIVELTGKPERIDAFLGLVRPYGILEAARSGVMAMPRTPIPKNPADEDDAPTDDGYIMDASLLPPG